MKFHEQLEDLKPLVQSWISSNPDVARLLAQKRLCKHFDDRSEEYGSNLMWTPDLLIPLYADYRVSGMPECSQSNFSIVLSCICFADGNLSIYQERGLRASESVASRSISPKTASS